VLVDTARDGGMSDLKQDRAGAAGEQDPLPGHPTKRILARRTIRRNLHTTGLPETHRPFSSALSPGRRGQRHEATSQPTTFRLSSVVAVNGDASPGCGEGSREPSWNRPT
jgi:hypothetical protein